MSITKPERTVVHYEIEVPTTTDPYSRVRREPNEATAVAVYRAEYERSHAKHEMRLTRVTTELLLRGDPL